MSTKNLANPYKGKQNEEQTRRIKQALVLLLILLIFLFFLTKLFNNNQLDDLKLQSEMPASVPENNAAPVGVWTSINQYDIINGICYLDFEISHVNNKKGDHASCFAACLGWNEVHSSVLCTGWTSTKLSTIGTYTCILRSQLDENTKVRSPSCQSARMWQSAIKPGLSPDKEAESLKQLDIVEQDPATLPERVELCGKNPFTKKRPFRIFIACLQASGCTMLSYLLAQKDGTAAILDMGVRQNMPNENYFKKANKAYPDVKTIILKAAVRGIYSKDPVKWLKNVKEVFNPDYSILFLRHPTDSFIHIASHIGKDFPGGIAPDSFSNCDARPFAEFSYGLRCGTPFSKLQAPNELFNERDGNFDRIVTYEDLCANRDLIIQDLNSDGYCLSKELVERPPVSILEVMKFSFRYFPSVRQTKSNRRDSVFWGAGHLQDTFHTEEGEQTSPETTFSMCQITPTANLRQTLLNKLFSPYKEMGLAKIESIAQKAAPDVWSYYEDNDRFAEVSESESLPSETEQTSADNDSQQLEATGNDEIKDLPTANSDTLIDENEVDSAESQELNPPINELNEPSIVDNETDAVNAYSKPGKGKGKMKKQGGVKNNSAKGKRKKGEGKNSVQNANEVVKDDSSESLAKETKKSDVDPTKKNKKGKSVGANSDPKADANEVVKDDLSESLAKEAKKSDVDSTKKNKKGKSVGANSDAKAETKQKLQLDKVEETKQIVQTEKTEEEGYGSYTDETAYEQSDESSAGNSV